MTLSQENYVELINLTRLYLTQEYDWKEWIGEGDPETITYFKKSIPIQQVKTTPAPIPPTEKPKPVVSTPPLKPTPQQPIQPKVEKPAPKREEEIKKDFVLEKLPQKEASDFNEMRKILGHLQVIEQIPDDSIAKQAKRAIPLSEVVILIHTSQPAEEEFLQKVAQAIQSRLNRTCTLLPVQQLEQDQAWERLLTGKQTKWILGCGLLLNQFPTMNKHFREAPKEGRCYLGSIPFLMLADLGLYLKEPALKASLWKALCNFVN